MKTVKTNVEVLLVKAEFTGLSEKKLLRSRNLGCVDLVWPQTAVAKKSAARVTQIPQFVFLAISPV